MEVDLAALARAVRRLIEGDLKELIPPPGFADMEAAFVDLFHRDPQLVPKAQRLLTLPDPRGRPLTTDEHDRPIPPQPTPAEKEFYLLSGELMRAVHGRTGPSMVAIVSKGGLRGLPGSLAQRFRSLSVRNT